MTSALTNRGGTRTWTQLRAAHAPLVATGTVICPRCGRPIEPGQPWDLGHAVDRIDGGTDHDVRPEHSHCNRKAGAEKINAIRAKRIHTRVCGPDFSDAAPSSSPRALSVFPLKINYERVW